ncbi:hypothetical protein ACQT3V_08375 [Brucella sp. NF 2653]|uniref:hypothetical protein n=1 Tax=Brucella sp. NF 2653 TaxID=693748 RepID=UPI003D10B110
MALNHVKDDRGGNRRINDRDGGAEELLADGCPFAGWDDRGIGKKSRSATARTKPPTPWTAERIERIVIAQQHA